VAAVLSDSVAANPVTHKVYVVNHGSNSMTIVDGSRVQLSPCCGRSSEAVAINPKTIGSTLPMPVLIRSR